jgi:hypothetical protein
VNKTTTNQIDQALSSEQNYNWPEIDQWKQQSNTANYQETSWRQWT